MSLRLSELPAVASVKLLCLDALHGDDARPHRAEIRDAGAGLPVDGTKMRATITEQVRWTLARLERLGLVRKSITAPEIWWELATLRVADAANRNVARRPQSCMWWHL
jgi:hypothetical protein